MFKRRQNEWFSQAKRAEFPISLLEMKPLEDPQEIASFLRRKIGSRELTGVVTPDDETYIPMTFIQQLISRFLKTKGIIDIVDLIDETNLPGEILEQLIQQNIRDVDGFLDLINRKFYTPQGSMAEIRQVLGKIPSIDLKFLLNKLYWSEDHLEAILDLMAQKDLFIGFIDPLNQRLYNFTSLDFSKPQNQQKSMRFLNRFLETSFLLESEASISNISNLTRLIEEDCLDFLEKNRDEVNFIFSESFDHLYPVLKILDQVLRDIFVYRDIPIEFWQRRLDVDRTDFIKFLKTLNRSLNGTISRDDFQAPILMNWFKNGINVEGLATDLNLDTLQLLGKILDIAKIIGLKPIAGDTVNPFMVKAVEHYEIFCQVDTSSYIDPHLYFECQNCQRIICSNCRESGSKHSCPFCDNISAFIIDLPRHCPICKVNYTNSYNLIKAEECYFCKKGPLKVGWIEEERQFPKMTQLDSSFSEFLQKVTKTTTEIPLRQISSFLKYSDAKTISFLEDKILRGIIQGTISIQKMTLNITQMGLEFTCTVCESSKAEEDKRICVNCESLICVECYEEMTAVEMVFCPECGGNSIQ